MIEVTKIQPIFKNPSEQGEGSPLRTKEKNKLIENLNKITANEVKFSMNDNLVVMKIFKEDSEFLIYEFPSEEFFRGLDFFKDYILKGFIFDKKS